MKRESSFLTSGFTSARGTVIGLLAISVLIRAVYVFGFTNYTQYIVSDMNDYWQKGWVRYQGLSHPIGLGRPSLFPLYLSMVFHLADLLHLHDYKLEIVLFLNTVYGAASVWMVYRLAMQLWQNQRYAFYAAAAYAGTFPLVYLNAFVLTENLAVPLLIIAVYLVFAYSNRPVVMGWTGMLFTAMLGLRPALAPIGIPLIIYLWRHERRSQVRMKSLFAFCLSSLFMILLVTADNYRAFTEKKPVFASNAGLQFFIAQCRPGRIQSTYLDPVWRSRVWVEPPLFYQHPNLVNPLSQNVITDRPLYDQGYFYQRGWECLTRQPQILLTNMGFFWFLFFDSLFPLRLDAWGCPELINLFSYLIFGMTVVAGLWPLVAPRQYRAAPPRTRVLLSMIGWTLLTSYFYSIEQRYLYSCVFAIELVFFTVILRIRAAKPVEIQA